MSTRKSTAEGMIDISDKSPSKRTAKASAVVKLGSPITERLRKGAIAKGDVLEISRVAGIMAAKKTSETIPLCHSIPVDKIAISFEILDDCVRVTSKVVSVARTGVEMEALVAVSVAVLTIYDMCKMYSPSIEITDIVLLEKKGGKGGHYRRE